MFSWSSQAEEILKVSESVPRLVDKKSRGTRGERGLGFSRRRKGQAPFFLFFLSLSHLKRLFVCLFVCFSFFGPGTDDYTTQFKLCESEAAQSCLTLCNPMDCSLPGSFVHGIFQARVLEWVAVSFSRGSSQARDPARVSHIVGRCFTI